MTFKSAALSPAGSAQRVNSISIIDIRVPTRATDGAMSVFEGIVPANDGPPMHIHDREDEMFYVLSGQFQFWCGDETFTGGPGTNVVLPRGVPHTFKNIGTSEGRLLVTVTPGGFENFFIDVVNEKAGDPAAVMAIGARYGLTFLPPKAAAA